MVIPSNHELYVLGKEWSNKRCYAIYGILQRPRSRAAKEGEREMRTNNRIEKAKITFSLGKEVAPYKTL